MIEAEFKAIDWLEPYPIEEYRPDPSKPFSVELTVLIGPKSLPGEEIFLVDVCNPLFLAEELNHGGPRLVATTIVVREFSVPIVEQIVRDYCKNCRGETWKEVALLLMRLGRWEFEGMVTP